MARSAASCSVSCASYFAASRKVLHKSALTDEAASFHSAMKHYSVALHNMKHFAYAPYDVRKWKMRVYPFAIQRYPHYIMTCNPVLYGWIFLYCILILPKE